MKKTILLGASVLLFGAFISKKEKSFTPPGTMSINDTLFVDEVEIDNLSWKIFVDDYERKYGVNSEEYKSVLPDTSVWRRTKVLLPYYGAYDAGLGSNHFPVVGINYVQVLKFCKWRTEAAHCAQEVKEGKRKKEDVDKPYTGKLKFVYRLPTKQEWEALAIVGYTEAEKKKYQKNNFSIENEKSKVKTPLPDYHLDTKARITEPVWCGIKTRMNVKNMIGNVSEMVMEKGTSKGGNWDTKVEGFSVFNDQSYTKADAYTGFRCVCVVKK